MKLRWRVGHRLGRTLYKDNKCVGIVDTPALAQELVECATSVDPAAVLIHGALVQSTPPEGWRVKAETWLKVHAPQYVTAIDESKEVESCNS